MNIDIFNRNSLEKILFKDDYLLSNIFEIVDSFESKSEEQIKTIISLDIHNNNKLTLEGLDKILNIIRSKLNEFILGFSKKSDLNDESDVTKWMFEIEKPFCFHIINKAFSNSFPERSVGYHLMCDDSTYSLFNEKVSTPYMLIKPTVVIRPFQIYLYEKDNHIIVKLHQVDEKLEDYGIYLFEFKPAIEESFKNAYGISESQGCINSSNITEMSDDDLSTILSEQSIPNYDKEKHCTKILDGKLTSDIAEYYDMNNYDAEYECFLSKLRLKLPENTYEIEYFDGDIVFHSKGNNKSFLLCDNGVNCSKDYLLIRLKDNSYRLVKKIYKYTGDVQSFLVWLQDVIGFAYSDILMDSEKNIYFFNIEPNGYSCQRYFINVGDAIKKYSGYNNLIVERSWSKSDSLEIPLIVRSKIVKIDDLEFDDLDFIASILEKTRLYKCIIINKKELHVKNLVSNIEYKFNNNDHKKYMLVNYEDGTTEILPKSMKFEEDNYKAVAIWLYKTADIKIKDFSFMSDFSPNFIVFKFRYDDESPYRSVIIHKHALMIKNLNEKFYTIIDATGEIC